jgi:hypothetical protein
VKFVKKILFLLFFAKTSFALKSSSLDSKVQNGLDNGMTYLKYAIWAAAVLGIVAIAFMLFNNIQEVILKTVVRVFAVLGIAAMAFVIPGWFNLTINLANFK